MTRPSGHNRARIKSHAQLKSLCKLLEWANASDDDESDRPAAYAYQGHGGNCGFYGHIWQAILLILLHEGGISPDALPERNFGGSGSWYEDLMIAVDNAAYTTIPLLK